MPTIRRVKLQDLPVGTYFTRDGKHGKLIYKNDCRARVKLQGKKVEIGDSSFLTTNEIDWGPGTVVEVTGDDEVTLDPETGELK